MARGSNLLRIIGGEWRGRKLQFPDAPHLRPTPDRVRETVFNWLMPVIEGAHCLDLFAGSGALGLEALSRGAAEVVFVDINRKAVLALQSHLQTLQAESRSSVLQQDSVSFVSGSADRPFELVFLDPPYKLPLMEKVVPLLEENGFLAEGALLYLEIEKRQSLPELPANWQQLKEKTAGEVHYFLFQRNAGSI